jgi:hypothetical protein
MPGGREGYTGGARGQGDGRTWAACSDCHPMAPSQLQHLHLTPPHPPHPHPNPNPQMFNMDAYVGVDVLNLSFMKVGGGRG